MHKDYQIKSVKDLSEYMKAESRSLIDYDIQLPHNLAFVYYLKNGYVIVAPNDLRDDSNGLLFNDKESYLYFLDKDSFPISNSKNVAEEKLQDEIKLINVKVAGYFTTLSEFFGTEISNKNFEESLIKLRSSLQKPGINAKVHYYSVSILGEYLRTKRGGDWILLKKYGTFNPYYTPGILFPDGSILILRDIMDSFFETDVNLQYFLNKKSILKPRLNINDLEPNLYKLLPKFLENV